MKIITLSLIFILSIFSSYASAELDFSPSNLSMTSLNCNDDTVKGYVTDILNNGYVTLEEVTTGNAHVRAHYPGNSNHSLLISAIYLYQGSTKLESSSGTTLKEYSSFQFLNRSSISNGSYYIKSVFALDGETSKNCILDSEEFTVSKVPNISSVSVSPNSAVSGTTFTWKGFLSSSLPSGYSMKVDFGDGYKSMSRSNSTTYSYSRVANTVGNNREYTIKIVNSNGIKVSDKSGYYTVTEPIDIQYAPNLTISSAGSSATQGNSYCINLKATDSNNNLKVLHVNWGDDPTPQTYTYNSGVGSHTKQMCHTYDITGSITWTAKVWDHTSKTDSVSKSIFVAANTPTINSVSVDPISAVSGSVFTWQASVSMALPVNYTLEVDFGDGYKAMNKVNDTTFNYARVANTVGDDRNFTVKLIDANNQKIHEKSGQYTVTEPEEEQFTPELSIASAENTGTKYASYCISLIADDANSNLRDIFVNWGDNSELSSYTYPSSTSSYTKEFCHTYSDANDYTWSATVYDHTNKNESISKEVSISESTGDELTDAINFLSNNEPQIAEILSSENIDAGLSRSEAVAVLDTFLYKTVPSFKIDTSSLLNTFADVAYDEWYLSSLLRLSYYHGIRDNTVLTKENSNFRPFDKVSRQEFVSIVIKGLNIPIETGTAYIEDFDDFDDNSVWADWAKPYFNTAVKHGLIIGNNNYLYPEQALTIKESVYIISRANRVFSGNFTHSESGFYDSSHVELFQYLTKSVGASYVPEYYLRDLSGIDITSVSSSVISGSSALESCGSESNVIQLSVNSTIENDDRVEDYYWWQSDNGYFRQYGNDTTYKSVCFFPSESVSTEYNITVQGSDNIGYSDQYSFNVDGSLFNYDLTNTSELVFTSIVLANMQTNIRAAKPYILDFSQTVVTKGNVNYSLENVDVTMKLPNGDHHLIYSGHLSQSKANFSVPKLEDVYGENIDLIINARVGEISQTKTVTLNYIPVFSVQGRVFDADDNAKVNAVNINGDSVLLTEDGTFYWELDFSSADNSITIQAESSALTNVFSSTMTNLTFDNPTHFIMLVGENQDNDRDGISNDLDPDDDNDGIPDTFEEAFGLFSFDENDANLDSDGDGLSNLAEYELGTNPIVQDSDGDGINDNEDTDPINTEPDDIDGDGMPNTFEIQYGLNEYDPTDAGLDSDNDGLTNLQEYLAGTDPFNPDSDGNGIDDGFDHLVTYSETATWEKINNNAGIKRYSFDGKPNLPQDSRIMGDNAYWFLGNGYNRGSSSLNTLITMNLLSGEISESLPMGKNYLQGNATVEYKGRLFSIGGKGNFISHSLNNLIEFDPVINDWRQKDASPLSRYGSQAEVYDGKIYVFGGYGFDSFNEGETRLNDDGSFYTDVDEQATWRQEIQVYDIENEEWTVEGSAPDLPILWGSTIIDDNVYFSAETDWITSSDIINRYNISNQSWDTITLPESLISKKMVSVGHLLIIYGTQEYALSANSYWKAYIYDTHAQRWFLGISLPEADQITEVFSIASDGNNLYLFEHSNEYTDLSSKSTYKLSFDITVAPKEDYQAAAVENITTIALDNGDQLSVNQTDNVVNLVVNNESDYNLVQAGSGSEAQKSALRKLTSSVYQNLGDEFQFIYFLFDEDELPSPEAPYGYHTPVKNLIEGIGQGIFDFTESYGSSGSLESVVVLPTKWDLIYGPSLHELGHRWGNYLASPVDSLRQSTWFGWNDEDAYHWGYLSAGGQLGGWRNELFNSHLSNPTEDTYLISDGSEGGVGFSGIGPGNNFLKYSALELYLMGLNKSDEVPDLIEPITKPTETTTYPIFTIEEFNTITMGDIIATNGERVPTQINALKSMNILFVVVSKDNITQESWNNYSHQVSNFTRQEEDDYTRLNNFWEATEGKAQLNIPSIRQYVEDSDNDGVLDFKDDFPNNIAASVDSDLDGLPDDFHENCDESCISNSGLTVDADDDGDNVLDVDDAFPLDASESVDTDLDGIGNNADTDDDGDNVLDDDDAFPLDASESIDTDLDGIGNNEDTDDDGDGIIDENDSSPLDPSVGDTQSPVFAEIATLTVEATGVNTAVDLIAPEVTDDNLNLPTVMSNYETALALGSHEITWTATDFAGNKTTAIQVVNIVDTTPPSFDNLKDLTMDARGRITFIAGDLDVIAMDIVEGKISATLVGGEQYLSGRHLVPLIAHDSSGNSATKNLILNINPIVSVAQEGIAEASAQYQLTVLLSGEASSYPVTVDYQIEGNVIGEKQGSVTFNENVPRFIPIFVADNAITGDTVTVHLTSVHNAVIADENSFNLAVMNENHKPSVNIVMQQLGSDISIIDARKGLVTIIANVQDLNLQDEHGIEWAVEENQITDTEADELPATFEFDPATIGAGVYELSVIATETNTNELHKTHLVKSVVIETELNELSAENDADFDGVADANEGYEDPDNDGIPAYLDNDSNTSRLPIGNGTSPMQTITGLRLSLGSLVIATQKGNSDNASITIEDIIEQSDEEKRAENQDEQKHFSQLSHIVNFDIAGLNTVGATVPVIIPLPHSQSIPVGATYRKYTPEKGWFDFVVDDKNKLFSAQNDSDGNCPTIASSAYQVGVNEGDHCILLHIEDGGENDADGEANGIVKDPGVLASENLNQLPVIVLPTSINVNEGSPVTIEASTTDAEGDNLTFLWQQESGLTVAIDDVNYSTLIFEAPLVSNNETLVFKLTVNDGRGSSEALVEVIVTNINNPPAVNFTAPQSIEENKSVTFDANSTDEDGEALAYLWELVSANSGSLSSTTNASVSYTAPEVSSDKTIEIRLTVTDGVDKVSVTKTMLITNLKVIAPVTPPVKESGGGGGTAYWLLLILGVSLYRRKCSVK